MYLGAKRRYINTLPFLSFYCTWRNGYICRSNIGRLSCLGISHCVGACMQSLTTLWKGIGSTLMVKGVTVASETAIHELTPLPRFGSCEHHYSCMPVHCCLSVCVCVCVCITTAACLYTASMCVCITTAACLYTADCLYVYVHVVHFGSVSCCDVLCTLVYCVSVQQIMIGS